MHALSTKLIHYIFPSPQKKKTAGNPLLAGLFCALTKCELEPCVFGTCQLTNSSYKCHCKTGYNGPTCEQKRKPCEGNPCESRGVCIEKGDGFQCRCHAWWEGARCEKRMLHIPYKPLSERMFHEPFWLGLMTVFVVMAVIGLVWCAKRHFPEKIEKLLAEENERNRSTSTPDLLSTMHKLQHKMTVSNVNVKVTFDSRARPAFHVILCCPGHIRCLFE